MHAEALARHPTAELPDRLRVETRAAHDAIERELDLMSAELDARAYRSRLVRLLGFYRPLEPRLESAGGPTPFGLDLVARRKVPWLLADLAALDVPDVAALPDCGVLPPLRDAHDLLGCLYVIEGATLGGRVIARHLERTLGLTAERGARFHAGYGDRTGERWRELRAALAACPEPGHARVVASARATFDSMRRWCGRGAE